MRAGASRNALGSSSNSSAGSWASALAIMIRCRWPSDMRLSWTSPRCSARTAAMRLRNRRAVGDAEIAGTVAVREAPEAHDVLASQQTRVEPLRQHDRKPDRAPPRIEVRERLVRQQHPAGEQVLQPGDRSEQR